MTDIPRETTERFEELWGREMTDVERSFFHAREVEGYRGWFDWQTGEKQSDADHQAQIEKRWADNEAAGLRYTKDHGWVQQQDAEASR